jgi:hypothetical protein
MKSLRLPILAASLLLGATLATPREAHSFCGFYVGKADSGLYNHASQVVLVRHEDKTVVSLMNDYKGELSEFALVVPVPTVLQRGQIHVGDRALFERIDAYSAPRLVEYYDPNPCQLVGMEAPAAGMAVGRQMMRSQVAEPRSLGVKVEAQYVVGEYDIVILSAKQSDGLETWLIENGYHVPKGAADALQPYIRQEMKFFVAKVNLKEQARTGLTYLRPLQFAYESPKFMLPIRLGMINAQGPQDLLIYVLTMDGRVETTNYRTEKLPSGIDLPEYLQSDFPNFYKAMFSKQVEQERMRTVFTEYFWNMGWCDPCAAQPLSPEELRGLGVFWLNDARPLGRFGFRPMPVQAPPVMITRLHLRYSADTFPEDLVFQETQDRENFQARYVIQHAWQGSPDSCPAARNYFDQLDRRRRQEAETLSSLTGWDINEVFRKAGFGSQIRPELWWKKLWE